MQLHRKWHVLVRRRDDPCGEELESNIQLKNLHDSSEVMSSNLGSIIKYINGKSQH